MSFWFEVSSEIWKSRVENHTSNLVHSSETDVEVYLSAVKAWKSLARLTSE